MLSLKAIGLHYEVSWSNIHTCWRHTELQVQNCFLTCMRCLTSWIGSKQLAKKTAISMINCCKPGKLTPGLDSRCIVINCLKTTLLKLAFATTFNCIVVKKYLQRRGHCVCASIMIWLAFFFMKLSTQVPVHNWSYLFWCLLCVFRFERKSLFSKEQIDAFGAIIGKSGFAQRHSAIIPSWINLSMQL